MITFEFTQAWEFYPGFIITKAKGMYKHRKEAAEDDDGRGDGDEEGDEVIEVQRNFQLSAILEMNGFDGIDMIMVDIFLVLNPNWKTFEIWFHNEFNLKQIIS